MYKMYPLIDMCGYVQSCLTLCDPMDNSPPGSTVHGIFQAKILEQVAISYSRGIFPTPGLNPCLLHFLPWQVDSLPPVPHLIVTQTEKCFFYIFTSNPENFSSGHDYIWKMYKHT